MRLFIYGSCVTRDMLEYPHTDITLVRYIARTSLAAQLSAPYINETCLSRLPSKFQREMMQIDMAKTLFSQLKQYEYDLLLLDFIDERFSIGLFDGARLTLSKEFIDANRSEIKYPEWNRFSQEKYAAWQRGFAELFALINTKVKQPKIVVNKVWFAANSGSNVIDAQLCNTFMASEIQRNNDYLAKLYDYISLNYPTAKFIEYPEKLFVANPKHKWGLAPFHYIDDLYIKTLEQLKLLV